MCACDFLVCIDVVHAIPFIPSRRGMGGRGTAPLSGSLLLSAWLSALPRGTRPTIFRQSRSIYTPGHPSSWPVVAGSDQTLATACIPLLLLHSTVASVAYELEAPHWDEHM